MELARDVVAVEVPPAHRGCSLSPFSSPLVRDAKPPSPAIGRDRDGPEPGGVGFAQAFPANRLGFASATEGKHGGCGLWEEGPFFSGR